MAGDPLAVIPDPTSFWSLIRPLLSGCQRDLGLQGSGLKYTGLQGSRYRNHLGSGLHSKNFGAPRAPLPLWTLSYPSLHNRRLSVGWARSATTRAAKCSRASRPPNAQAPVVQASPIPDPTPLILDHPVTTVRYRLLWPVHWGRKSCTCYCLNISHWVNRKARLAVGGEIENFMGILHDI